jgi:hypothetical protein
MNKGLARTPAWPLQYTLGILKVLFSASVSSSTHGVKVVQFLTCILFLLPRNDSLVSES